MNINKKKILVMGGGGFIGGHLARKLNHHSSKYSITAVGNNIDNLSNVDNITLTGGKITTALLNEIECPEVIYFLLGGSSVGASLKDPEGDFIKTVDPLLTVLRFMRESKKIIKLIYVSSAAVYGKNASEKIGINTTLEPMSPYGFNKKIGEDIILYYCQSYGVDAKIIRPFSVYGPGLKKQLIWDVLEKITKKENTFFGTGEEKRDWVYIDDLINHLMVFIDEYHSQEFITNAGSGKSISIKEIIKSIYSLSGLSVSPEFKATAKFGDPVHLVSNPEEQIKYDRFYKTSIEDGLIEVIKWYNSRGRG